jgi:carbamoyltransferase
MACGVAGQLERIHDLVQHSHRMYELAFKPSIGLYGQHDPSAALFDDGELVFGVEEERLTRQKHAANTFPERAIEACLDYDDLGLGDVDRVLLPYEPSLRGKILPHYLERAVAAPGVVQKAYQLQQTVVRETQARFFPTRQIERRLADLGEVPPIETLPHHACHAASAFHPSGFEEAVVLTVDAKGEYDSTVVWHGTPEGLERVRTYEHPNSLGLFFAAITEFLGYRMFNGEGKVMGLAPYGSRNEALESTLRELVDTGVDYDVTGLVEEFNASEAVQRLESLFDRDRAESPDDYTEFETDLACVAQRMLEETVVDIAETYCDRLGTNNVGLAGGVMLNCKANQAVIESPQVDDVFIQPVAHDAGLALGAGWLEQPPAAVSPFETPYWGPEYATADIRQTVETNKLDSHEPDDVPRYVAEQLADGALVGWFQGQLELGPRALGNRSILADPRSTESRDRINRFVKHREEWRPFAPSMLESAVDEYLTTERPDPFMITTSDVPPDRMDEITAVVHPADGTTRPQTVSEDDNPRYHRLISEFADVTGVPMVLNTSFNDHGEPIVNTPKEAIKDFYGMGLDVLVLEDVVIEK